MILPESVNTKVLRKLHSSHLGIVKTKSEARCGITKNHSSCHIYRQLRPSPTWAPLTWKFPPTSIHTLHIDLLGPINNQIVLVVVDAHTKWVEVYDVNTYTRSAPLIERLYDFMSRYGLPHTIVCDNGAAFTSSEFKHFCLLNGINHLTSPAYNLTSNGQAERFVKIVKKGIKSCVI